MPLVRTYSRKTNFHTRGDFLLINVLNNSKITNLQRLYATHSDHIFTITVINKIIKFAKINYKVQE